MDPIDPVELVDLMMLSDPVDLVDPLLRYCRCYTVVDSADLLDSLDPTVLVEKYSSHYLE